MPSMNISYLTSDDSVYDDYWQSEDFTSNSIPNQNANSTTQNFSQETEPNNFKSDNEITGIKLEENTTYSDHSLLNTSTVIEQHHSDDTNIPATVNRQDAINANAKSNIEERNTLTSSDAVVLGPTLHPKDVNDDNVIEALFLCELNYDAKNNEPISNLSQVSSSAPSDESESSIAEDKYQDFDQYFNFVAEKDHKQPVPTATATAISSGVMKDYSSENPYAIVSSFQSTNLSPLKRPRRTVKRLRNNRRRLHSYYLLHQKFWQRNIESSKIYTNFTNSFGTVHVNKKLKRKLSSNSTKSNHQKFKKSRRRLSCLLSLRSYYRPSTLSVYKSKLSSRKMRVKKKRERQYRKCSLKSVKSWVYSLNPMKKTKKPKVGSKSDNINKSATRNLHADEVFCNPYIKRDPDFKPWKYADTLKGILFSTTDK